MKVTMDKTIITLSDAPAANELREEYKGYDKDLYDTLINCAVQSNKNNIGCQYPHTQVITIDKVEITKNRYQLTAWIECLARVDLDTIVKMHFDAQQAMQYSEGQSVDAYIEVYKCKR